MEAMNGAHRAGIRFALVGGPRRQGGGVGAEAAPHRDEALGHRLAGVAGHLHLDMREFFAFA